MKLNVLEFLTKFLGGVSWWRVGFGVLSGVIILCVWHFIWVSRPNDFYNNGVKDETQHCRRDQDAAHIKALELEKSREEERSKVAVRPHSLPDVLLNLMQRNDL